MLQRYGEYTGLNINPNVDKKYSYSLLNVENKQGE